MLRLVWASRWNNLKLIEKKESLQFFERVKQICFMHSYIEMPRKSHLRHLFSVLVA